MPRPMTPPPMITISALSVTCASPRSAASAENSVKETCVQLDFRFIRKTDGVEQMMASMLKGSFDFNLFRAIEVFVAVVETRHVTQAAQMLGITQSAASQHLKNLETALGVRLFDRNLRPIELTRAG